MCLTVPWNGKIEIAEADIPVWKVCDYNQKKDRLTSTCLSFRYASNTKYSLKGDLVILTSYFHPDYIERGFHAYRTFDIARKSKWLRMPPMYGETIAVEGFYIPKGAQYVIGTEGDIVSNKLYSKQLWHVAYE